MIFLQVKRTLLITCFFSCHICLIAFAQQNAEIEILNANTFEGDESLGPNVSRLLGDVRFRHKNTLMFCDSAYLYQQSNSLEAFGKIIITKGDSIRLLGNKLNYDGNTSVATVTGDVVLTDRKMTLYSDDLTYNMDAETGSYIGGGKILDAENVLTSETGTYHAGSRTLYFKYKVRLENPSYHLTSDTLTYNTFSKVAGFHGPTYIYSHDRDSSFIYCRKGWYNTASGKSYFGRHSYIRSGSRFISADSLLYDRNLLLGRGFNNVSLKDTVEQLNITGDYGFMDDKHKTGFVTGKTLMTRYFDADTLYLHADTLFASQDTIAGLKNWQAFHGVKFFKNDLQGKCDSIAFSESDSLMRMFKRPVIWNETNQLTADSIMLLIYGNEVKELIMRNNSFICSSEDSLRYNQVRGRDMTGQFVENELNEIFVIGNGQSIYYTRNNKDQITGVNRADCSDMVIRIEDRKIREIGLINQPEAILYPPDELSPKELILKGFRWRGAERPLTFKDIFE